MLIPGLFQVCNCKTLISVTTTNTPLLFVNKITWSLDTPYRTLHSRSRHSSDPNLVRTDSSNSTYHRLPPNLHSLGSHHFRNNASTYAQLPMIKVFLVYELNCKTKFVPIRLLKKDLDSSVQPLAKMAYVDLNNNLKFKL